MSTGFSRIRLAVLALLLAGFVFPLHAIAHAEAKSNVRATPRTKPNRVVCNASIQHPVLARITALDPVRRGQAVRLRVDLLPQRALERAEVRVSSSGGAAVTGGRSVPLRAVPAGGQASADFMFMVPSNATRTLIQFEIDAEGAYGRSRRGVTFNLLPDGPAERPRLVRLPSGEAVAEVTARRIER